MISPISINPNATVRGSIVNGSMESESEEKAIPKTNMVTMIPDFSLKLKCDKREYVIDAKNIHGKNQSAGAIGIFPISVG